MPSTDPDPAAACHDLLPARFASEAQPRFPFVEPAAAPAGVAFVCNRTAARPHDRPVTRANPRSLEVGANGEWYIALGAPNRVARYESASNQWSHWDIGHYAHEARFDGNGRIWFNAHFSKSPVTVGYVEISTGDVVEIDVPTGIPPKIARLRLKGKLR